MGREPIRRNLHSTTGREATDWQVLLIEFVRLIFSFPLWLGVPCTYLPAKFPSSQHADKLHSLLTMATDLSLNRGVAVLQAARSETSLFSSFISASPGMLNKPAAFRAIALANTPRVRIIARASPGLGSDNESDGLSGGCGAGSSSTGSSAGRASSPQRSSSFSGGSGGKSGGSSGNAGAQSSKVLPPAAHGNVTGATIALEKGAQDAEDVDEATRRAVLRGGEMQRRQHQQKRRAAAKAEEEDVVVEAGGDLEKYIATYNRWVRLGGRLDKCVGLLEQMHQHALFDPNQIYHNLFFSMCKSERAVASAFRFVALLESAGAAQLSTYNQLLSVCSHCADVASAQRVLRMVQASRWRADTALYTALIAACCKAAKLDLAFKVYHDMEAAGVEPNVRTFGTLVDGCAKQGHVAKAFGAYGILISKGLKPDRAIFNALITACGRAGSWERVFDVLVDMRSEGLTPDHVTMGAVIAACANCGQVERALEVYEEMRAGGVRPSLEVFTAAVHACSQTGDLPRALAIYEHLKQHNIKPDEILFSALINVAAHANKPDAALALLQEMRRARVQPGTVTYAALMGMYNRLGLTDEASQLYAEVKAKRQQSALLRPSVPMFNALITSLCQQGCVEEALSALQDMRAMDLKPDKTTYALLIAACKEGSMVERAFSLYHEAQVDGIRIGHAICESMIEICVEQHRAGAPKPSFSFVIGHLPMAFDLRHPDNDWAECGLAVYRQSVACGVIPTLNLLSKLLCLLRVPHPSSSSSSSSPSSSHTDLAGYAAGEVTTGQPASPFSHSSLSSSAAATAAPAAPPAFASRLPPSLPSSAFALSSISSSHSSGGSYAFTVPETAASNLESASAAAAAGGSARISGSSGAGSASSPLADVFDLYEPLAYSLYEEAEVLGAVPVLSSTAGPISLRFAGYPPNLAEVCVLVLLRGLLKKYRAMPGMKIFPIALHLPVESVEVSPLKRKGKHTLQIASRTSQGVAALLRRLGLPYFGYESSGVLRITASAVTRWLRLRPHAPTSVPLATITGDASSSSSLAVPPGSSPGSPFGSVPAVNPLGLPVGSARGGLGSGILQQQRAIRMRGAAAAAVNQMQQQQQQQQGQQQARHRQQQQHQWDESSEEDEEGDGRGRMGRYGAAGAHRMTVGGAAVRKQLQRWSPEAQLSGKKWERAFAGWESDSDEDEEFIIRQGFKH
ncbi:unnamed protein product [Closterium sp. Yama58-4]|nr:unnamed protein product [Closterium sp. Yama58-4]